MHREPSTTHNENPHKQPSEKIPNGKKHTSQEKEYTAKEKKETENWKGRGGGAVGETSSLENRMI